MGTFERGQQATQTNEQLSDEQALRRYRYLLQTAPPEDIERAHEEAFARLTPEQRQQALQALAQHVPASEIQGDDPASLARTATRAEVREPGTIERAWGGGAAAFGLGSFFLTTIAATFIGTSIAQALFADDPGSAQQADGTDTTDGTDTADAQADQAGAEGTAEGGGWDEPGADGGDLGGDTGGDWGGGDFGGGDLGGGDFGGGDLGGF
jgi:hypothetical protein